MSKKNNIEFLNDENLEEIKDVIIAVIKVIFEIVKIFKK